MRIPKATLANVAFGGVFFMKRNFYIFSNGRLHRKENTLFFTNEQGEKKVIPIETVRSLYVFGEADFNVKFLDFLTQHEIMLHVFNYYGFYSGSIFPEKLYFPEK